MAYTEPKTDWEATDNLTHVDYNRIKNNLVYINDLYNQMYPNPYIFNPGPDMGIDEMFKASKWNMFEDCIEHFKRSGQSYDFGERSYYEDNGHLPDYNQLNRIERCIEAYAETDIPVTDFTLSADTLTLGVGETQQLSVIQWVPANATDKTVTWQTSDNTKATIDANGLVTAIAEGSVTITATCPDGISKTCAITVIIKVTNFTLSKSSCTIYVGETEQLSVTSWTPANATHKTVVWTSSNTSMATVDSNGLVTAIAQGSVTITATCPDGIIKTCAVTVAVPIPVTNFTLNKSSAFVDMNDTLQLSVTSWTPSNATYKTVTWASSDTSKATVDANGLVTGLHFGEVTITATCRDGVSKTCDILVGVEIISENLLTQPYDDGTSKSDSGVTFTVGSGGKITTNGINTTWFSRFDIRQSLVLQPGSYILGGRQDIKDPLEYDYTDAYVYLQATFNGRYPTDFRGYKQRVITLTEVTTVTFISVYTTQNKSANGDVTYPKLYKCNI